MTEEDWEDPNLSFEEALRRVSVTVGPSETRDDLWTAAHVARLFHVNRRTVNRWVKEKKVTPVAGLRGKHGVLLFYRSDILVLLKRK